MDSTELLDLVETGRLTYKPGWEIHAGAPRFRPDDIPILWPPEPLVGERDVVAVWAEFWADNSSPAIVDPRPRVYADGAFLVACGDAHDRFDVYRQCLNGFLAIEAHEAREFLRVDGWAPFHPHRLDGEHWYRETR